MQQTASAPSAQRIAVMGTGIGGLAAALALQDAARTITLIERDPAPPALDPLRAFEDWKRPGVPQLRHTHIFLARLQSILRVKHPRLLAELEAVGVQRGSLDQLLPAAHAERVVEKPGDADLLHMWGRRATLEYVVRKHVERLQGVEIVHETTVEDLLFDRTRAGQLQVTGVQLRGPGDRRYELQADVVVDGSGRSGKSREWLNARGAGLREEVIESGCGYYCRHYKQRSGAPLPPRRGTGASLDYLVFGLFFAEHDTFSIAIACPELETALLERLRRPHAFDELCDQIPVLRQVRMHADPISRVLGGADLASRWRHFSRAPKGQILGFFTVGDAYLQTNPIYGRGCASAFVQAQCLAEALRTTSDPLRGAILYHRRVWKLMRPHFDFCVTADRAFLARARHALGARLTRRDRAASYVYEKVLLPALEQSPAIAREWLKAQQMCEVSPPWVAIGMLLYMLWLWPWRVLTGAPQPPARLGPTRAELLRACPPLDATSIDPAAE